MNKGRAVIVSVSLLIAFILIALGIKENNEINSENESEKQALEAGGSHIEDVVEEYTIPEEKLEYYHDYGDERYVDGEFIVCIDPGHGGDDDGAEAYNRKEKDDNLTLSKYIKYQLEEKGIKVIMTRTTDETVDLEKRPAIANENKADLMVSVHRNNYEDSSDVKGFEIWVNSFGSDNSYEIASNIMDGLEKVGISRNREVKRGTMDGDGDYLVIRNSSMPCVLLEMGFISSPTDNDYFIKHSKEYAKAIADAIQKWSQEKTY